MSSASAVMNEERWAAMLEKRPSEKVVRNTLMRSGCPEELRRRVWMKYSGAYKKSKRGVFSEAVARSDRERQPAEMAQIEMDISRSGVTDVVLQTKLRRVLRAWTAHRPNDGYVQGQNFIAAGLLHALPEEEAFWMLVTIVDDFLPDHYSPGMSGNFLDCRVLADLIARRLPDVSNKLAEMEVSVQLLATRWFLTLWSSVLPPRTLLRVYDTLFLLGPASVPLVALSCFHVMRPTILAARCTDDLANQLACRPLRETSAEAMISAILYEVGELSPSLLEKMRAKHRAKAIGGPNGAGAFPPPAVAKRATLGASLQQEFKALQRRLTRRPAALTAPPPAHSTAARTSDSTLAPDGSAVGAGTSGEDGGGEDGGGEDGGGEDGGGSTAEERGRVGSKRAPLGSLRLNVLESRATSHAAGGESKKARTPLIAVPAAPVRSSTRSMLPVVTSPVMPSPAAPVNAKEDEAAELMMT